MTEAKFQFTLTGFIVAMILIAMFGTIFALFISATADQYDVDYDNTTFQKYGDYTASLTNLSETVKEDAKIKEDANALDIIGSYFRSGYTALKTASTSLSLFNTMIDDAGSDIESFALYKTYIILIVMIMVVVGIIITVLVKMRV